MRKSMRYFGLIGVAVFVITVALSSLVNPWFDFNRHSFSHLGWTGHATSPIIYNTGMVVIGVCIILYAISFILDVKEKIKVMGGSFLLIAGIFLIFVGIFHMGTRYHNFVSLWFFLQSDLAFLVIALALILEKNKYWIPLVILTIFEYVVLYGGIWPSVATVEAFGIFLMFSKYIVAMAVQFQDIYSNDGS